MKTPTNNPKNYLQPEWEKELRLSGGARRISFRYNLLLHSLAQECVGECKRILVLHNLIPVRNNA